MPGCTRKETVDIDILVTTRNGNRKIMHSIKITSRPPSRIRNWNQFSQSITVFVAYPTITSSNLEHYPRHDNSIPWMAVWKIYRDTEQPQEKETS